MSSGTGHEEIEMLLRAYALDAVEPDEAAAVARHLAPCPRCRAEVDAHREMAGALGTTVQAPPPDLWDRIAGRPGDAPRAARAPQMPRLAEPRPAATGATTVGDLGGARPRREAGSRTSRAVLAVSAAVVVVAVLGVNLSRVDHQLNQGQRAIGPQVSQSVINAAQAGPHRVAQLRSPSGARLAEFVMVPDGRGYQVSSSMATLPDSETYQLWRSIGGKAISLGLLGSDPSEAAFTVAGRPTPTRLLVTVDPTGGVATPDRSPAAVGKVVPA